MSFRTAWADLLMKTMSRAHKALVTVSNGRIGWTIGSLTAVELTRPAARVASGARPC